MLASCKFFIYTDLLTTKELSIVQKEIWEARSKWINLGLELGLKIDDLEAINLSENRNIDDCLTKKKYHIMVTTNESSTNLEKFG